MCRFQKNFPLVLIIILTFSSILIPKPTFAQTSTPNPALPSPSIPEFTVKPVGPSFDIPTVYSTDPNSGQLIFTQDGYHIQYCAVEITIKNQPLQPGDLGNGSLFYNVRIKTHNYPENYWFELYNPENGYPTPSKSNYTSIPIPVDGVQYIGTTISTGAQTDIQVEAMIGRISRQFNANATDQADLYPYVFIGTTSGWSDIQTVTLPPKTPLSPTSSTATSMPTATPVNNPPNSILLSLAIIFLVVIAFLVAVIISLLLHMRKQTD